MGRTSRKAGFAREDDIPRKEKCQMQTEIRIHKSDYGGRRFFQLRQSYDETCRAGKLPTNPRIDHESETNTLQLKMIHKQGAQNNVKSSDKCAWKITEILA